MKVYKYIIQPYDYFYLELPKGARILTVQYQEPHVCLWALVDPEAPTQIRKFRWAGTGHEISEAPENLRHVSTFFMQGELLVFHIFEILG